jgi:hypothetical protein
MALPDYPKPPVRRLRVYAFDPHASTKLSTASFNVATIELPWEAPWEEDLRPGPVNDYLEVIDMRQYCTDLDAITTKELTEWRSAFQASLTELSTAAKTGLAAAQTALSDAIKADVADAKAAADEAKRAADAAKAASLPANLNLTIANAPGGEAVVTIDGNVAARGPERTFALANLTQGNHACALIYQPPQMARRK